MGFARTYVLPLIILGVLLAIAASIYFYVESDRAEQEHFERNETELVIENTVGATIALFRAGKYMDEAKAVPEFTGDRVWLAEGNYFLQADQDGRRVYYPIPILGYRSGTDGGDAFGVTIRPVPTALQPAIDHEFSFIPSGYFLFGDRLNPREPHLVWTPGFYIGRFEVSNGEFRKFLSDAEGYENAANWTPEGIKWKAGAKAAASASLSDRDENFSRFGRDDQPVTQVTWHEAAAFCQWLTRKFGQGNWLYSLPTEAEWEKAARGPDNFDYPLSQFLSDPETGFYNWKKNPHAETTVIGSGSTDGRFRANRYGVFHMGGNVVEWTQGLYWPFSREKPYSSDDGRNRMDAQGVRVVRGGSWYSASIALLYIPYRDTFLPEISHDDLGFRIVARNLMQ